MAKRRNNLRDGRQDHGAGHGGGGQKPILRLMGRSLQGAISFIEDTTGKKLTAEDIARLKKALPEEWLRDKGQ
jgi:hypothetical protein